MNFESMEIYAKEAKEARSRNQDELAKKLDEKIMRFITEHDFLFPVNEEPLIDKNNASFIYKNNKTYPNLLEFIAKILHIEIPILIDYCKFGPGGINVVSEDAKQAHQILVDCTRELQRLIQAKGRINEIRWTAIGYLDSKKIANLSQVADGWESFKTFPSVYQYVSVSEWTQTVQYTVCYKRSSE